MAGKIFINYRRGDDPGFTHALFQRLEDDFPDGDLFMDVEGFIKPGDDFVKVLTAQVAACDVLLAVIGPRWVELIAARAGDPEDFVAIEIKAALDQDKRVIPVLVGGAAMPRADNLPEPIRALARRNAVGLRPDRFKSDCQGLVSALKEHLASAEQERAARTEAERAAAEAERLMREAEQAARLAAVEERAREQRLAGLSPEEVRKAEELANWEFIKERGDPPALRNHLARFPEGVTTLYAQTKLEDLAWAGLGRSPSSVALKAFLDEFPSGAHAKAARARLAPLLKKEGRTGTSGTGMGTWPFIAAGLAVLVLCGVVAYLALAPRGPDPGQKDPGAAVASSIGPVDGRTLKPGDIFRDCDVCPEMVVVPASTFSMGSPSGEEGRDSDEGPQRDVKFDRPFAVGKFEVTFAEWDACAAEGGCSYRPGDAGWGRGKRPVINISWNDITQQYVPWLSRKTGKIYRLLSEAEWEYVARAGTTSPFWWGTAISTGQANYYGAVTYGGGPKGENRAKSVPVDSFAANAWGLFNVHGNVWEWVQDCRNASYNGAPLDGAAWTTGDCSSRTLRGGSWDNNPGLLRSANRDRNTPDTRMDDVGFRVARTL